MNVPTYFRHTTLTAVQTPDKLSEVKANGSLTPWPNHHEEEISFSTVSCTHQNKLTTQKIHCFSEMPNETKKTDERSACQLHPKHASSIPSVPVQGSGDESRRRLAGCLWGPALWLISSPSLLGLRAQVFGKFQQTLQTREMATRLQVRSQHGSSSPSCLNAPERRALLTGLQGVNARGFAVGTAGPVPKSLAAPTPSQLINTPLTDLLTGTLLPERRGTLEIG